MKEIHTIIIETPTPCRHQYHPSSPRPKLSESETKSLRSKHSPHLEVRILIQLPALENWRLQAKNAGLVQMVFRIFNWMILRFHVSFVCAADTITLQGTITNIPYHLLGTFESMIFLSQFGGICDRFLEDKPLSNLPRVEVYVRLTSSAVEGAGR